MKRIVLAVALVLTALPAMAQYQRTPAYQQTRTPNAATTTTTTEADPQQPQKSPMCDVKGKKDDLSWQEYYHCW